MPVSALLRVDHLTKITPEIMHHLYFIISDPTRPKFQPPGDITVL